MTFGMEKFRVIGIEGTIKDLVARVTKQPLWDIHLNSHLKQNLGLDSLDVVELTVTVEKFFNIELSDAKADQLETVSDLVNIVVDYLGHENKVV